MCVQGKHLVPTLFTHTRFNQEVQHFQVPPVRRKVQRGASVAVAHVQGPAAGSQQLGHPEDVALSCQLMHGPRGKRGRRGLGRTGEGGGGGKACGEEGAQRGGGGEACGEEREGVCV